jgi:hypothetical protein
MNQDVKIYDTTLRDEAHERSAARAVPASCLAVGAGFTVFFDSGWAHLVGILALFGFVAAGFVALAAPAVVGDRETE